MSGKGQSPEDRTDPARVPSTRQAGRQAARDTARIARPGTPGTRTASERIAELEAMLDQARDAIFVRDLQQQIIYWGRGAERLYGFTAEEALGASVFDLIYDDSRAARAATTLLMRDGHWSGELQQVSRDGRRIVVEARWTLVRDKQGRPRSILSMNTDLTDRRHLESQLLRTQRLESIGSLAGGVAHNLNNILAPILMSLRLLEREVSSRSGREVLDTLRTCAEQGADLVRKIQGLARGSSPAERREVDLAAIVADVRQIVQQTFPKNIALATSAAPGLERVIGDPTLLHQVLVGLCLNARDAMPAGGRLEIGLTLRVIGPATSASTSDARPGRYVAISVADTGTGIPPDLRERIFEPFFTTKGAETGTGLGLSTALSIVQSHGGFIDLHSEPGVGTRFEVCLPAAESCDAETAPAAGALILLVDDEASLLGVTRRVLEQAGYRVIGAAHGKEGLATFLTHRATIRAVITDLVMPEANGVTLIQAIRALDADIPIIACTGHADPTSISQAHQAGVARLLPKPHRAEVLLSALATVLRP